MLLFIRIAYNIICAWDFKVSPLKKSSSPAYIYVLGYLPIFLILFVMVVEGLREQNEDLIIKQQRRDREQLNDRELGIGRREKVEVLPMKDTMSDVPSSTFSGSIAA